MGYANKIIKEKEGSVVVLEAAKDQLNVDTDFHEDDSHILFLIEAATGTAEDYTGIDISLTSNTLEYIDFNGSSILIKEAPFNEMISVEADGVPITDYEVEVRRTDFTIHFDDSITCDKLIIKFYTGYYIDTAPYQVVSAILVKINDLYDIQRTTYTIGANYKNNEAFERLLSGNVINRW